MTERQWSRESVRSILDNLKDKPGPLLPVLHGIQDTIGYVPEDAVPMIAEALNLSRAEVHGVVSFYHYFRSTPPGRRTIYVCRAESCQSMRSESLESYVKSQLGIDYHETTQRGDFSLEPVYCLGNCACSPAIMIDQDVFGRVTPERFDEIIENIRGAE